MAAVNVDYPSLLDQVKLMDPNGAIARVVESLQKQNPILEDAVAIEGNLPTGHVFTSRTGLPALDWRRFNEGIAPSKSRTAQVTESVGRLGGLSVVDVHLANLNGNAAALRASEDKAFMMAMNQEVETGIIYHSTRTAPEKFMGLAPRLDATTSAAGSQIILADATAAGADQTSMYLVGWSPDTVALIYPKGSVGGLQHKDMGEQLWSDANNLKFRAYVTEWEWKIGLMVKDWRYVVRIANIDTGNLLATGDMLAEAMITAYHQVQSTSTARFAWYCNRTVATYLHLQARDTASATLTIDNIAGRPVTSFMGIPIRVTDALHNGESPVT